MLLGAGMDTRPFRLGFGRYAHTVFEVDGDEALLYAKHEALAGAGFRPRCAVKLVGADTSDASAVEGALSAAGFDPRVPTRWVLESEQPCDTHEARHALYTLACTMGAVAGSGSFSASAPSAVPALLRSHTKATHIIESIAKLRAIERDAADARAANRPPPAGHDGRPVRIAASPGSRFVLATAFCMLIHPVSNR